MSLLTSKIPNEVTPANMKEALQQAIEIEIATLPVYLYTYYSINRTPDQSTIQKAYKEKLLAAGVPEHEVDAEALDLSADVMVMSNKAGALIMSVVVEEMLHMALSSNVKQALAGMPELVGKSPSVWPAYLAGHEPAFPINKAPFSLDTLHTFLLIESPLPFSGQDDTAKAIPYQTIGEFYSMIENCIKRHYKSKDKYNQEAAQLIPGQGYYAQNSTDSLYYDKQHKPQFPNAETEIEDKNGKKRMVYDGDLIHVVDKKSALLALETIVEQGEGHTGGQHLFKNGKVDIAAYRKDKKHKQDYVDPEGKELSHFYKFLSLYVELYETNFKLRKRLKDKTFDVRSFFVKDLPINPSTSDYPAAIQKVSTLTNAVYTYLFIMTEACYRKKGNTQYEIFMFGIHKTMIWILSLLCEAMTGLSYTDANGKEQLAAPTFENYEFSNASSPKSQLLELANEAAKVNSSMAYYVGLIGDLPDVGLESYLEQTNA